MFRFCCNVCDICFESEHVLRGHLKQPHTDFLLKQRLFASRKVILSKVKFDLLGSVLPCYYELSIHLPNDYCPQLKDNFGDEGRPIGVATAKMTILVYDVLGDYMQVRHEGERVWIQYIDPPHKVLVPSIQKPPNFWKDLYFFNEDAFFMVSDDLSESVEIKVRLKPEVQAEICGYLKKKMIVRCLATLRDWIQIVFKNFDTVWVLQSSEDVVLLKELPEDLQLQLRKQKIPSPHIL